MSTQTFLAEKEVFDVEEGVKDQLKEGRYYEEEEDISCVKRIFRFCCYNILPVNLLFLWFYPLVLKGFKNKKLDEKDLLKVPKALRADKYAERLEMEFEKRKGKSYQLTRSLLAVWGWEFFFVGFLESVSVVFNVFYPLLLSKSLENLQPMIEEFEFEYLEHLRDILPPTLQPPEDIAYIGYRENDWEIWLWMLGMNLLQISARLLHNHATYRGSCIGVKIRSTLITLIHQKSFKLKAKTKLKHTKGKIINLIANDCGNYDFFCKYWWWSISSIITAIFAIFFLYFVIDWSVFISLASALPILPIIVVIAFANFILSSIRVQTTDKKIQKMTEVFHGINIIKLFHWEGPFIEKIMKIRKKEVFLRILGTVVTGLMNSVVWVIPEIMIVVSYIMYYVIHRKLDPVTMFTTYTYFDVLLRPPLYLIPAILWIVLETVISSCRITVFLNEENLTPEEMMQHKEVPEMDKVVINIENGVFEWPEKDDDSDSDDDDKDEGEKKKKKKKTKEMDGKFKLTNINVKIKQGDLVIVVGKIGAGKSSLFSAMLDEMTKVSGTGFLCGSVAYCSQTPWIQNATLLDNILFGRALDENKFNRVIEACALKRDLEILDGGRMIEIGEKGINLSGGQKYRVSLARSCYFGADIYMLDDPFASIDGGSCERIFKNCIEGYLGDKTRIIITHSLQFIQYADLVIYMENGSVAEAGTYNDIMKSRGNFRKMMKHYTSGKKLQKQKKRKEKGKKEEKKKDAESGIVEKEDKVVGSSLFLSMYTVFKYFPLGLFIGLAIIIFQYLTSALFLHGSEIWITNFASPRKFLQIFDTWYNTTYFETESGKYQYYDIFENSTICLDPRYTCWIEPVDVVWELKEGGLYSNGEIYIDGLNDVQAFFIYFVLIAVCVFIMFFGTVITYNCFISSSASIFKRSLSNVLYSSFRFFESNPVGRIVNRFSSDINSLDDDVPSSFDTALSSGISVVALLGIAAITTSGLFVPFLGLFFIIYFCVFQFYRRTLRELKRLNSIARSPLISSVDETMKGLTSIKAFRVERDFVDKNQNIIDSFNKSSYMLFCAEIWLAIQSDVLGLILQMGIIFVSVMIAYYIPGIDIKFAFLSLGITYTISSNSLFSYFIVNVTTFEANLNAVERLQYYLKEIKAEEEPGRKIIEDWSIKKGKIQYQNYSMKYRENLPFILKKLNFTIKPQERIAIVGRTGSGKSTIVNALFRTCALNCMKGDILIDGQKISDLSIECLRNNLSIIPQDPVLFEGTVRFNMDPFNDRKKYTDEMIWDALKRAHLEGIVTGLDMEVKENGSNFSVGEIQLFCLARALLRKPKILIMDECTSALDLKTDEIIQKTIRKDFKCTTVAIAHRLKTIIDFDKIVVVDDGSVVEIDTPQNLIEKKESYFYHMIMDNPDHKRLMFMIRNKGEITEI